MRLAALLLTLAPGDEPALPELGGETVPWELYAEWLIAERGEKRLGELALEDALAARARAAGLEATGPRVRAGDLARRIAAAERVVDDAALRAAWEQRHGPGGRRATLFALRERVVLPATSSDDVVEARYARLATRLLERRRRHDADGDVPGERLLDLGPLRADAWPADVARVLANLAPDTWTEPLRAGDALYVFRVRHAARVPFAGVRAALREELERAPADDAEVAALLDEVWGGLELRVLPGLLAPDAALDAPAAEANGEVLSRDELARRVARAEGRALVFAYCAERVTRDAASAAGIEVAAADVAARARALEADERAQLGGGDEARWRAALLRGGEGPAQARRRLTRRAELGLLQDALLGARRRVTPEDLLDLFEERHGPGGRDLVVRVLVRVAEPGTDVERDLRELRQLVRTGQEFAALIALNSDDPLTREAGGRLPTRFRYEDLEESTRARLEHARPGDLVGPVFYRRLPWTPAAARRPQTAWRAPDAPLETPRGYHVLLELVDDVRTAFQDVAPALEQELRERPATAAERARWTLAELQRVGWGTAGR